MEFQLFTCIFREMVEFNDEMSPKREEMSFQ